MADVAIICGSASDAAIADKAKKVLDEHKVSWDYQVISAHRDPDKLDAYVKSSTHARFSSPSPGSRLHCRA